MLITELPNEEGLNYQLYQDLPIPLAIRDWGIREMKFTLAKRNSHDHGQNVVEI
jgi:hypothetical protein